VDVIVTRRDFLIKTGLLSAAAAMHVMPSGSLIARPALDPNSIAPFVDALSIPPIAASRELRPSPDGAHEAVPYYRVSMRQFERQVHRDLPPTRQWGYDSCVPGPTFEARSGRGILIEWSNDLPRSHFLPIDHRLHGAERKYPDVRAVVHVHGAKTPAHNDGYPEDWYVPGKSALYYYPNQQDAAMLWYHDHAMGINRLNIFAGLLGNYFIRDDFEDALHLPGGEREIPLVLCDRMFDTKGQLYYPESGKPDAPWIPEFFGNIVLINGKLLPYLNVEPAKYRIRLLNGSNARHFYLSLSNTLPFNQIGTDQGLLPAPVTLQNLLIAPAERADLIIDFADYRGQQIVLSDLKMPLMQFRVSSGAADRKSLPKSLRPVPKTPETAAIKNRMLTLDEFDNKAGEPILMLLNGTRWHMPITENPELDSVEIWNLINMTDDAHPIHLHLVRFQILDRRRFDKFTYQLKGTLRFTGAATPPEPNEAGWKDTVRADPGMVTRIIVRFEGYPGRYVWHCHNLDHEDNEMMRPYEVVARGTSSASLAEVAASSSLPICRGGGGSR
jgi:spore coat protein A, manganese oxidase